MEPYMSSVVISILLVSALFLRIKVMRDYVKLKLATAAAILSLSSGQLHTFYPQQEPCCDDCNDRPAKAGKRLVRLCGRD